jgi:succinate-acetate transporter protein
VLCDLQIGGADSSSVVGVSGSWHFIGGIALNIAGLAEFVLGNTFSFVVFIIYGCHWLNQAYTGDPSHALVRAYGPDGAISKAWNSGQGNYFVVLALVAFVFLLGSLRTNVPFVIIFFTLIIFFGFYATTSYRVGRDPIPDGLADAAQLLKIGSGFGFVAAVMGG